MNTGKSANIHEYWGISVLFAVSLDTSIHGYGWNQVTICGTLFASLEPQRPCIPVRGVCRRYPPPCIPGGVSTPVDTRIQEGGYGSAWGGIPVCPKQGPQPPRSRESRDPSLQIPGAPGCQSPEVDSVGRRTRARSRWMAGPPHGGRGRPGAPGIHASPYPCIPLEPRRAGGKLSRNQGADAVRRAGGTGWRDVRIPGGAGWKRYGWIRGGGMHGYGRPPYRPSSFDPGGHPRRVLDRYGGVEFWLRPDTRSSFSRRRLLREPGPRRSPRRSPPGCQS